MGIKAGDRFSTNGGGSVVVLEYRNYNNILIEHLDENRHTATVAGLSLRNGMVKNPYLPSVYGVGYLGAVHLIENTDRNYFYVYNKWKTMLERCYSAKYHARRPTYIDCLVVPEWHNFKVFLEWHKNEPNSENPGFNLDKDLRLGGNKVYGPSTCSFVPAVINNLLLDNGASRGLLPQGVSANGKGFRSCLCANGKQIRLGTYSTPGQAHEVYKKAKEVNVRSMAEEWKEYLHPEVYDYLKTWVLL